MSSEWLGGDEFYYLSRGLHFSNGYMPYRDFQNSYGMIFVYITAIPHLFSNNSYIFMRVFTGLLDSVNAVLVYLIGKRLYCERAGFIASTAYIVNFISLAVSSATMSEPYIVFFILAGAYFIYNENKPFLSAFLMSCGLTFKFWTALFILPPVLLLILQRKLGLRYLLYLVFFSILTHLPFIVSGGLYQNLKWYFLVCHDSTAGIEGAFNLPRINRIISAIMSVNPASAVACAFFIRYFKWSGRPRLNFFHLWFLGNLAFIFFSDFYWDHHPLLTLAPACLIAGNEISPMLKRFSPGKIMVYVAIVSYLAAVSPYHDHFRKNGNHPITLDKTERILHALSENFTRGDVFLEDFAVYSYLSGLPTSTLRGWHWRRESHEDILEVINATRPSHIIVSVNGAWPRKTRRHFEKRFVKIYQAEDSPARIYYTGYNQSKSIPGIDIKKF